MHVKLLPYDLVFKQAAGTSRGVLHRKRSWFIIAEHAGRTAIGECGIFAGLSFDDHPDYESKLRDTVIDFQKQKLDLKTLNAWPSIRCGWEMLLQDLKYPEQGKLYHSPFFEGQAIPINGLIWMNNKAHMAEQIDAKLASGFHCIKLKIGAINFEEELALLAHIRARYNKSTIEIRLDANGAFESKEALEKLERLAAYDIHSIEQPIRAGQPDEMAKLCAISPIDIALDEELISVIDLKEKSKLLDHIRPQYIILKPSLHGGFQGSEEWISIAESMDTAWWATSALESNIGLNAISQWLSANGNPRPQGLGTGQLYVNNIPSPLEVSDGSIRYDQSAQWDYSSLLND